MIESMIIPITISAVILLLLWLIFHGSSTHWLLKIGACAATAFLSVFVWFSIQEIKGWPIDDPLPQKYRFFGASVVEPGPTTGLGQIYLTASDLSVQQKDVITIAGFGIKKREPRVYKIPYSRDTHKKVQAMMKGLGEGQAIVMEKKLPPKEGEQKPKPKGEEGQLDESVLGQRVPGLQPNIKKDYE
jgi:hypothetical protein